METSTSFSLAHLNSEQQKAVVKTSGAALVIAGAGSGKTRVITSRIAYLISECNAPAQSIVALTFTNKAAKEMKERITKLIPENSALPFVGTFHSYCLLLLRKYRAFTGINTFTIIDSEDQKSLLKRILEKFGLEKQIATNQIQHAISCLKNQMQKQLLGYGKQNLIEQVNLEYEREKKNGNLLDFDDLIVRVLDLFKTNSHFKEEFQRRVKHVLIDEYQDTNTMQHSLLKEMTLTQIGALSATSVCAVGDEDQSIYSWRGAQVENMRAFKQDFAPVELIKIEQNYRSAEPILKAANHVISHNRNRTPKELWSEKKAHKRIMVSTCSNGYQEADIIALALTNLPKHINQGQCAILYRTHAQTRVFEEIFMRSGIPYTIIGGIRFYERKEIKDILAFLRLIQNPHDKISLLRVLNVPQRGLGEKVETILIEEWDKYSSFTFTQLLQHLIEQAPALGLSRSHVNGLSELKAIFTSLTPTRKITELYEIILQETNYQQYLAKEYEQEEFRNKSENLRELYQSISYFEKQFQENVTTETAETALAAFLNEISLLQEKIADDSGEQKMVKLMTLHSAKGLEFEFVIIAGLEETILPSNKSLESREDIEEERRLFYVGITRAREYLLITRALTRSTYGQRNAQDASRFLNELPEQEIIHIDASNMFPSQLGNSLRSWLDGSYTAHKKKTETLFIPDSAPQFIKAEERGSIAPYVKPHSSNQQNKKSFFEKTPQKTTQFIPKVTLSSLKAQTFTAQAPTPTNSSPWQKNVRVFHPIFGTGVIASSILKGENRYLVTVIFPSGEKAILSTFLQIHEQS